MAKKEDRVTSLSTTESKELERRRGNGQLVEGTSRDLLPPVEIYEDSEAVYVLADMPGVSKDSLNVEVANHMLEISGDIAVEMPQGVSATFAEIRSSRYRRQFALGRELDHSAIEATIKDGVVQIKVPKTAAHRRRRIEIKAA